VLYLRKKLRETKRIELETIQKETIGTEIQYINVCEIKRD
jgi:hypothetical protein